MDAIKINKLDNVAVALNTLSKGEKITIDSIHYTLLEEIPQGHKFALSAIKKDENVMKYGYPIGHAKEDIEVGQWIHTHNILTNLGEILSYEYKADTGHLVASKEAEFMGYQRENGKVGIRNEVWIVPTVGCVNSLAEKMKKNIEAYGKDKVDGVYALPHPYGCSQMGDDQLNTQKALAGLVKHPNAGAILVLGLGCENNNIELFKTVLGDYDPNRVAFLECQSIEDEMEAAHEILIRLIDYAATFNRTQIDASELVIGLKCGGSDGLSGITANPLVGKFSDLLITKGGSTILTEVPEMFGAETILMNRSKDERVFEQTVELVNGFKDYFESNHQVVYENPSPGNKKGGISTLEDKSLGCIQKGGTAEVVGVLGYGEEIKEKGLNLLLAPGNDLVAATALAMAGAHIILFTTGLGTPFGAPVPTIKISSNNKLFDHKKNWIDFNAGSLLTGSLMDVITEDFFQYVIHVASGEKTKAEINGYREMAIFKQGVTL